MKLNFGHSSNYHTSNNTSKSSVKECLLPMKRFETFSKNDSCHTLELFYTLIVSTIKNKLVIIRAFILADIFFSGSDFHKDLSLLFVVICYHFNSQFKCLEKELKTLINAIQLSLEVRNLWNSKLFCCTNITINSSVFYKVLTECVKKLLIDYAEYPE